MAAAGSSKIAHLVVKKGETEDWGLTLSFDLIGVSSLKDPLPCSSASLGTKAFVTETWECELGVFNKQATALLWDLLGNMEHNME